jgi:hypothetical protein
MEAASPLPFAQVHVRNGRLLVDHLVVDDATAVRLAAEAERPAELVAGAIAIGARVLDREQTVVHADFVKAEFERAARELRGEFTDRAKGVADRLDQKVDEVFGEHGGVTRILERHFGDESSVAVQHRMRQVLAEVAAQMREDLRKQLTSDSDSNPIVQIQRASLKVMRDNADQQSQHLRAIAQQLEATRLEVAALKAERERLEEVAAEAERGTAKGRSYEEAVVEAIDAIARAQGDDCDAVGDLRGVGGRSGDVLVAVEGCSGPPRGRIVFEAKNSQLSKRRALDELDAALETRGADYAVFVVPGEDKLPARTHPLREVNGDKMFVVFDPEDGSRLALEVAYALARARVLMARGESEGVDLGALRVELERAQGAMEDVRRVKAQLTNASSGIEEARKILDAMAQGVRGHLAAIEALLARAAASKGAEG